jgi:pYEATS domain-containing protein involved in immunity
MAEPGARNPTAMWIGAGLSAALILIFLGLKAEDSPILGLQPQWLLVALVPIIVGLVVGGYVHELKAGDYGVDFTTETILAKSKPIADSDPLAAAKFIEALPATSWQSERVKEYERTRGYMLAHIYRRSKEPGQKFDISMFVVQHRKGTTTPPRDQLDELESAEFFFGESWGNKVFKVRAGGGFFGVRTHAWGTFLAICRITFKNPNDPPIILYRYIDFFMAGGIE